MGVLTLIRFGLSAIGIGLFVALFVILVGAFVAELAGIDAMFWTNRVMRWLFPTLMMVLLLRWLVKLLQRRLSARQERQS